MFKNLQCPFKSCKLSSSCERGKVEDVKRGSSFVNMHYQDMRSRLSNKIYKKGLIRLH